MLTPRALAEHLQGAIDAGEYFPEPYPLHVFKPFPDHLYEEILEQLPETAFYRPIPHPDARLQNGVITRFILSLRPERVKELPPAQAAFWGSVSAALVSPEVRDVLFGRLEAELLRRLGRPWNSLQIHPEARLMRDGRGYRLSIHPDEPNKLVTWQTYLPHDQSQEALGTSIFSQDERGGFSQVRKLKFSPNTAYCFAVTERSWHGVEPIAHSSPRNSLIVHYFQRPDRRF